MKRNDRQEAGLESTPLVSAGARRALAALATGAAIAAGSVATAGLASATSIHDPHGNLETASVNANRSIYVKGWAFDPDAPTLATHVDIRLDGTVYKRVDTRTTRKDVQRTYPAAGARTGFTLTTGAIPAGSHSVCAYAVGKGAGNGYRRIGCKTVTVKADPINQRIADYAETFIGRYPYVWGGSSPSTGFDCSGLSSYVYRHVGLTIPRTSQQQFDYVRAIPKSSVRRGDLVFSHDSTGHVYHVGIYESGNKMVAAMNEKYGIGYQTISATGTTYGTITH